MTLIIQNRLSFLLFTVLSFCIIPSSIAQLCSDEATTSDGHQIIFNGVTYENNGATCTSTWSYCLIAGPGNPAISHFMIANDLCIDCFNGEDDFVDTSHPVQIGHSAPTGHCGIKYDFGPDPNEEICFSFTLNNAFEPGPSLFVVKAGNGFTTIPICGPVCTSVSCEEDPPVEEEVNYDCASILSVRSVENTNDNCGTWCDGPYVFTLGNNKCYVAGNDLVFVEYLDGTALLSGTVLKNGKAGQLNVSFSGRTDVAPSDSPKYDLCINSGAEDWYYYSHFNGTFTAHNGAVIDFVRTGPSFQVGYGANLQDNEYGASGWFFYSNGANAYSGDMNFQLSDQIDCVCENNENDFDINCVTTSNNCEGGTSLGINVDITGNSENLNFNWSNGATTQNISNLNPGTYTLTVTNAEGCSETCGATVSVVDPLNVICEATNSNCTNNDEGMVTVNVNGGTPPYTYIWDNGNNNNTQSNLSEGTYNVTVTDANGCEATCSSVISVSSSIDITCTAIGGSCLFNTSNAIVVNVSGGTGNYSFLWSNGATSQNLESIPSGTYGLTVTDDNGCQASCETTVDGEEAISLSCEATPLICGAPGSGTVSVNVSGGTAPYNYHWNNGMTSQNLTNLYQGTYGVTVTDANGCSSFCQATVTMPAPIIVISSATPLACYGDNNSTASLYIEGGTPPYTYLWDNGSTEPVIENLGPGFYGITVTDANGCTGVCGPWIESPDPINAIFVNTLVSCPGDNDGSISTTVTGGTAPYTFEWNTGDTTPDLDNLETGDYTLTVSDNNGCTNVFTTTIETIAPIEVICTSTPLSCHQDNSGSINLNVSGGSGTYTFEWSTGASSQNIENLNPGDYSVTITDENGCTETCSTTVESPTLLTVNCTANDLVCGESGTGSVEITVEGGTAPYTYQWNIGASTQNLSGLDAGDYNVIVFDANGCYTGCVAIIESSEPLNAICTSQDLFCGDTDTGAITVSIEGGTAPFSYEWSNGASSQNLSNLSEGTYDLTVTDANGCISICNNSIESIAPLSIICQGQNLLCGESTLGNIEVTLSGGTAPYAYEWSNGAVTADLNDVPAGTYSLTVTDINGCSATCEASMTYVEPMNATCSVQYTDCGFDQSGNIELTVSGGTMPYTFLWSNGADTKDISNLESGDYTVTITDANGCTSTCSSSVSITPALAVVCNPTGVTCGNVNSGSIEIEVSGGADPFTFLWSNGEMTQNLSDVTSGSYEVTVTDFNGCTATCSTTVEVTLGLLVACSSEGTICGEANTGTVELTVQGGTGEYTFEWSNGETTSNLVNLEPGPYSVTVTDTNGCVGICSTVVEETSELEAVCISEEIPCGGEPDGAVDLTVSGGTGDYSFEWNNGETTEDITGVGSGTYQVTVTDANGCTTTCSNTVTEEPPLQLLCVKTNILCKNENNGSIDVTVTGGVEPLTYEWSNGANSEDLQDLSTGTYTITVTDANGCSNSCAATITEPANLLVVASGNNISCNGAADGTAFTTVLGGKIPYTYEWSHGNTNPFINELAVGTYTLTVTDANGCTNTASVIISEPEVLSASCNAYDEVCQVGSGAIDLNVAGGTAPFTYAWSNGASSEDLFNLTAGDYLVTVTDAKGCTVVCSSTVNSGNPIVISGTATLASCGTPELGSIDLTVSGGTGPYSFLWSNGNDAEDNLNIPPGAYSVTVSDQTGCSATYSNQVEAAPSLSIQLSKVNAICNGSATGSISLMVDDGISPFSFQWSNGSSTQNIENLTAGNYTVTVTDANGCQGTASATITQPSNMLVVSSFTPIDCNGDTDGTAFVTAIGGTSPYQYAWSNDMTTSFINSLSAGTYEVTVTDAYGCTGLGATTIAEPAPIEVAFTIQQIICPGDNSGSIETSINGGLAPYSYQWSNGENTAAINGLSAGEYFLIITDSNGCSSMSSATIETSDPLVVECIPQGVLCADETNGAVDLMVSGGTQPYSFAWSNGATGISIQDLTAGQYDVTVTDANGCTIVCSSVVEGPEQLSANYEVIDISCHGEIDGIIIANGEGGLAPYTYEWSTGDSTSSIDGVGAGAYGLTLTDANGCIFICGMIVNEPDPLTCSAEVMPAVSGIPDLYDLQVMAAGGTGAYMYSIDNGVVYQESSVFTDLEIGTYSILVTDENGCLSECGPFDVGSMNLGLEEDTKTVLSPNPTQESLTVEYETETEGFTIFEVKDTNGKVHYTNKITTTSGTNSFSVDTGSYAPGTYFLIIYTESGVQSTQFIVLSSSNK